MAYLSLHTRTGNFLRWIRPDPDKREETRSQRDDVKVRIKRKAEEDGLVVRSMPHSGSFAKSTGLRRHMLGGAEHAGQDVDCPFVLSSNDDDGKSLTSLLPKFEAYAKACYPDTEMSVNLSSVKLLFASTKLNFDLVPMLAVDGSDEEQVLLRGDGERRLTSIQKHVSFVKSRTKSSKDAEGRVAFNDAVRLVKWWREFQITKGGAVDDVPSFLIELLCAKAFDEVCVKAEYPDTLALWFDRIASYAACRTTIAFGDFNPIDTTRVVGQWKVVDPVNATNNAVPKGWGKIELDEFGEWAAFARDKIRQSIAFEIRGRSTEAVQMMSEVFGSSFQNHSEDQ